MLLCHRDASLRFSFTSWIGRVLVMHAKLRAKVHKIFDIYKFLEENYATLSRNRQI